MGRQTRDEGGGLDGKGDFKKELKGKNENGGLGNGKGSNSWREQGGVGGKGTRKESRCVMYTNYARIHVIIRCCKQINTKR